MRLVERPVSTGRAEDEDEIMNNTHMVGGTLCPMLATVDNGEALRTPWREPAGAGLSLPPTRTSLLLQTPKTYNHCAKLNTPACARLSIR